MEMHAAKRVEIIIEAVMEARLTAALRGAGVPGYTVLPVMGVMMFLRTLLVMYDNWKEGVNS